MSEPTKSVETTQAHQGDTQQPGAEPKVHVTREDKRAEITKDFLSKYKTPEEMAEAYYEKEFQRHKASKESASRRHEIKEKEDALTSREKAIQLAEEQELISQNKFKELSEAKTQEVTTLNDTITALQENINSLSLFKGEVQESQKAQIEGIAAKLSKESKAIYDTASNAMPEEALADRLTLLNKLTEVTTPAPTQSHSKVGIREATPSNGMDSIYALKESNPELYRAKLVERARADIDK